MFSFKYSPRPGTPAAVEHPGEQVGLASLQRHDLLLDGVGGDQPVDDDGSLLPDPVRAIGGLILGGRRGRVVGAMSVGPWTGAQLGRVDPTMLRGRPVPNLRDDTPIGGGSYRPA